MSTVTVTVNVPVPPPAAPPAGWTRIRYVGVQGSTRYAPHHTDEKETPDQALKTLLNRYLEASHLMCVAYYPRKDEAGEFEVEESLFCEYDPQTEKWTDWK